MKEAGPSKGVPAGNPSPTIGTGEVQSPTPSGKGAETKLPDTMATDSILDGTLRKGSPRPVPLAKSVTTGLAPQEIAHPRVVPDGFTVTRPPKHAEINETSDATPPTEKGVEIAAPSAPTKKEWSPYVRVPEKYQDSRGDKTVMDRDNFEFLDGLLQRHGLVTGTEAEPVPDTERKPFGREEFFSALAEFRAHGDALRADDKNAQDVPEPTTEKRDWASQYHKYKTAEETRASNKKLTQLSYHFIRFPDVKIVYDELHAAKMAVALPGFAHDLAESQAVQPAADRTDYFITASEIMNHHAQNALDQLCTPDQRQNLSWLIGHEQDGIQPPSSLLNDVAAQRGNGTFITFLGQVVKEGLATGEDLDTKIRHEFLEREGLGFGLMRVSLAHAGGLLKLVDKGLLGFARMDLQSEDVFTKEMAGRCPAALRGRQADGKLTKRPIAYEYAATILGAMPDHLRRSRR